MPGLLSGERVHEIASGASETRAGMDCEVRAVGEDGEFEGIAVRFNTVDSYRTTFDRNAFSTEARSLPLLWNHNRGQVVGSIRSMSADSIGLRVKGKLNLAVQRANEVRAMLQAGDIGGLSIGFRRFRDEVRAGGVRHITKGIIDEVSFVAIPSVPGSIVTSVRGVPDLSTLNRAISATIAALKGA